MEIVLVVVIAALFVLALFWFVAKTIGKLPVVRNSPTLNDIEDFVAPGVAEQRKLAEALADDYYDKQAECLSANVRALVDQGDRLSATKMYMEETGVSLLEAKRIVDIYHSKTQRTRMP